MTDLSSRDLLSSRDKLSIEKFATSPEHAQQLADAIVALRAAGFSVTGRTRKYQKHASKSKDVIKIVLRYRADGKTVHQAAEAAGVSYSTAYKILQDHKLIKKKKPTKK